MKFRVIFILEVMQHNTIAFTLGNVSLWIIMETLFNIK
jgi:hypothetical protein